MPNDAEYLDAKNRILRDEIDRLRAQVEANRARYTDARRERDEYRETVADLREQLAHANRQAAKVEAQRDYLAGALVEIANLPGDRSSEAPGIAQNTLGA